MNSFKERVKGIQGQLLVFLFQSRWLEIKNYVGQAVMVRWFLFLGMSIPLLLLMCSAQMTKVAIGWLLCYPGQLSLIGTLNHVSWAWNKLGSLPLANGLPVCQWKSHEIFFCRARWKLDTHSMGMDGILGWIKLKSDWLTDQRLVSDIISKHKWMLPNSICQIRDLEQWFVDCFLSC